jgi:hypothetical protein
MTTSFQSLLTKCLTALGDPTGATWNRTTVIIPWANEAILSLPILRPMQQQFTQAGVPDEHRIVLASDFREIVSVEYPISQDPPVYLTRKNRFDPEFYSADTFYDVERDYKALSGWALWTSKLVPQAGIVNINYLANHKTDCTDSGTSYITVPDEYVPLIVADVVCKGYRERLGFFMQNPTLYIQLINQMTNMVLKSEDRYQALVTAAVAKLTDSRTSPHMTVDKFDRVY